MDIEVRVPATSANLGPGFDCLGVALGTHLQIRITPSDKPEITGKGRIRSVPDNLTYRSFLSGFEAAGIEPPIVRIEMTEIYPSARGLGASASAIVAGLVAARAAGDLALTDEDLGRLATSIEGHSDNVLPALFGGLILNSSEGWLRFEPSSDLAPLVLIARDKFKTKAARRVLPNEILREDAISNAAATAALVAALNGKAPPEALLIAMQDRLHEPYRLPLMPESMDLHAALRAKGIPTALSGAGPSLLCIVPSASVDKTKLLAESLMPEGWRLLSPGWDLQGAQAK